MPARIIPTPDDTHHDPLAFLIAPPSNESPDERDARISGEIEAKLISDAIDTEIARESIAEKKAPKPVKVLLLGQSESGKSTTLKNFQLMYEPKAFRKERVSWRAVIQLNVVRSIHVIFEAMSRGQARGSPSPFSSPSSSPTASPSIEVDLWRLKARLAPLSKVEDMLIHRLSPSQAQSISSEYSTNYLSHQREVAVNSSSAWKDVFSRLTSSSSSSSSSSSNSMDVEDEPGRILNECAADMKALWAHPIVQDVLERQNVRLEETAGFFLDCLDEVTGVGYLPTDDHILRARLKTLGVSEHRVRMSTVGGGLGTDWRIFDVGGHRSLRAAWVPYFDDMDAIIFLAPISAFDQVLAEAPKVNRLEDSVLIWTSLVSNKLLANTDLILFLNKCDIMKAKLASGIKLRDYVVSYGHRGNDFEGASNYLRKKFAGILKENSPVPRTFYCHLTSVIDTLSTRKVIANIKDMLMRENLKNSTLLM